jgi:hypothetical protein
MPALPFTGHLDYGWGIDITDNIELYGKVYATCVSDEALLWLATEANATGMGLHCLRNDHPSSTLHVSHSVLLLFTEKQPLV